MHTATHAGSLTVTSPAAPEGTDLAALLRAAQRGDVAAFELVLRRHEKLVYRTAWRLLGSEADAEDAAQEVFLRLHRTLGQFRADEEFVPWLYRLTVNVCRDQWRRQRRHLGPGLDLALEVADTAPEAWEQLAIEEQRELLREGLAALSEKERAAVVLREIEELPTEEVARILGSSPVTVRSQVSAARVKLRAFVQRALRRKS